MTPFRVSLTMIFLVAAVLLAAGCVSPGQNSPSHLSAANASLPEEATGILPIPSPPDVTPVITFNIFSSGTPLIEIPGSTTTIISGATSVADLKTKGVSHPETLDIPAKVTRYDLVAFNIPAIRKQLESGQGLPVRIRGKDYLASVSRRNPAKTDNGIETYDGQLSPDECSDVTVFLGPDQFFGTIILKGEHFEIKRGETEMRAEYSSPLHYIYSNHDLVPAPARLCGGGFEAYTFADNVTPQGTAIVLTEKDFREFPEISAVIRGEKNMTATCDRSNDRYPYCIGAGRFSCEEACTIGRYIDVTDWRNTTRFGSGITRYVTYDGKNYYLQITWVS